MFLENELLQPYYRRRDNFHIEDGVIMLALRVVIPEVVRNRVLKELHRNHPGIVKMKALSRMHAWYPRVDSEIETVVKECQMCPSVANEMPKSVVHPWSWPIKPMDRIPVDFFEYEKYQFLLFVDSYSKWMDVKLMRKTDTASTIKCLKHWFSIYGLPNQLISDNGSQFTSQEFNEYMKLAGINHMCVAAYHHSSNGQVERYVQIVKKGLKCNPTTLVQENLEEVLTGHRSTPSTAKNRTPSKLFMGREI